MYQKGLTVLGEEMAFPAEALPEGMLFVRIAHILTAMLKAPIIAACLFILALSSCVQYALSSTRALEFTIYGDGTTHVFYQGTVDPQSPDSVVGIFGNTTDNLVVRDQNGTLLSSKAEPNGLDVETLGASSVKVDYDTPDLVSKNGKTWTFRVDSPLDYSVLLPANAVIVGMSTVPTNLQVVDGQSLISLPSGSADINYVFGVLGTSQSATMAIQKAHDFVSTVNSENITTPLASEKLAEANSAFNQGRYSDAEALANDAKNAAIQEQQSVLSAPKPDAGAGTTPILIAAGVAAAGTTAFIMLRRTRNSREIAVPVMPQNNYVAPDKDSIFKLRPELRQEDREIIAFISEKGGRVFESELRKKFLLPRTTTWRAVKRLEREGIVEIEKVDQQNLIKLQRVEGGSQ